MKFNSGAVRVPLRAQIKLVVHVTNEDAARSGVIGTFDERVPRSFDRSVGAALHFVEFRVADRVVVGLAVNVVALQ